MKNRQRSPLILRILLAPILIPIFLIGFITSLIGEKAEKRPIKPRISKQAKRVSYDFEMQLISNDEEQTIRN